MIVECFTRIFADKDGIDTAIAFYEALLGAKVGGRSRRSAFRNVLGEPVLRTSFNRSMTKSLPAPGCEDSDKLSLSRLCTRQEEASSLATWTKDGRSPASKPSFAVSKTNPAFGVSLCCISIFNGKIAFVFD